jgi:hypothetical protein
MANRVTVFSSVQNFFNSRVFNNKTNTAVFLLFIGVVAAGLSTLVYKSLTNRVKVEKRDIPLLIKLRVTAKFDVKLGNDLYVNGKKMTNDKTDDGWFIEDEFPKDSKLYTFTINDDPNQIVTPEGVNCLELPEKKT